MMNKNLTISFTSPKGGVGRTMTLANFARIYSNGIDWLGIDKSNVLLVDLDFNAPGIHYYNFYEQQNASNDKIYILNKTNYSKKNLDDELRKNKIGLAFYFSELISNTAFVKKCDYIIGLINNNKKEEGLINFREFVFENLFSSSKFNPIQHLIQLPDKSIFIYPAGSPRNLQYKNIFFDFDWLIFIKYYLGDYLIKYLIEYTTLYIQKIKDSKPLRVLLDQQAGISIPGAINRSLADSNIYVAGFNKQNKEGLNNLLKNHLSTYKNAKLPWIILNQYNIRNYCFDISTSIINESKSPHFVFRNLDEGKRKNYIKNIENIIQEKNKINDAITIRKRIYVTEFSDDAIQKEYFYNPDSISYRELVDIIVNIEKYFNEINNSISSLKNEIKDYNNTNAVSSNTIDTITVIGERVQLIDEPDKFYGPFYALLLILSDYYKSFEENVNIYGYAATHEQIAELAIKGSLNNIKLVEKQQKDNIRIFSLENGNNNININELDFISYPYYVSNEEKLKKEIEPIKDIYSREIDTTDSLSYISESYLEKNIIGWKDYAKTETKTIGVPLFVIPQLLVFLNETVNRDSEFQKKFHREYLRHFNGFNDPTDILNYAEVTKEHENIFKKILLCSNEQIAKFYEWQTISGIFNFEDHVNNISSKEKFVEYFFKEGAVRAINSYIRLFNLSGKTKEESGSIQDWDILLNEFFHKKNNSMIFLWPDTIPRKYRKDEEFIYQLPPAFHYFEECWMLSVIKKDKKQKKVDKNLDFIIHLMKKEVQQKLLEYGGLPVHKSICTNIDNWYDYPFLPHLWRLREIEKENNEEDTILKRKSFKGYYGFGRKISEIFAEILNDSNKESLSNKNYFEETVKNFQLRIIDLVIKEDDKNLQEYLNKILGELDNAFPYKNDFIEHFNNKIKEKK